MGANTPAGEKLKGGNRSVEIWLWAIAALIFAMVVVGGATRLTGSGLSITEWKPIMGAIPPLSEADWIEAFDKYKKLPQYELINKGMPLGDFKFIFWWEWSHRLLGRLIGFVFALPLLYFWATGKLRSGIGGKLAGLLTLGGLQGAIGWYMVSSGLSERVSVSQYRLALHLTMALAIFALVVWMALDERRARLRSESGRASGGARVLAPLILASVFLQIVLGAFVAGLKAGLIYNTWPSMDGQFVPSDYWLAGRGWMSLFESHAATQFNHRVVAYLVVALILAQMAVLARGGAEGQARRSGVVLLIAAFVQVALGILTLVHQVPLWLALMHQAGAVFLLAFAVIHLYAVQHGKRPA